MVYALYCMSILSSEFQDGVNGLSVGAGGGIFFSFV